MTTKTPIDITKEAQGLDLTLENGRTITSLMQSEANRLKKAESIPLREGLRLASVAIGQCLKPPRSGEEVMALRARYMQSFPNNRRTQPPVEPKNGTPPVEVPAKNNEWTSTVSPVVKASILGRVVRTERPVVRAFTQLVADEIKCQVVLVGETIEVEFLNEATAKRASKAMHAIVKACGWKEALPPQRQDATLYLTRLK